MSGYWDAVGRAALGLPGSAEPRPRSVFEPHDFRANNDTLEEIETAREVEPEAVSPSAAAATGPQPIETPNRTDTRTDDRVAADDDRTARPSPLATPVVPNIVVVPAVGEAAPRAVQPAPIQAHEAPLHSTLDRLVVQPIETIHVLKETQRPSDGAPSTSVAYATETLGDDTAPGHPPNPPSVREDADELPQVVIAETAAAPRDAEMHELESDVPPPLIIEINHIDIRIGSDATPVPALPKRSESVRVPSLADYLARRTEQRR